MKMLLFNYFASIVCAILATNLIVKGSKMLAIMWVAIGVMYIIATMMCITNQNDKIQDFSKYGTRPDTTITIKNGICDTSIVFILDK